MTIFTYSSAVPDADSRWEILASGGIFVTYYFVPPGETPPFFGPAWTEKLVNVRGHTARLFQARKENGANVEFRTIRWEVPSNGIDGAVQFAIDVDPNLYTEADTLRFIELFEPVD